MIFAPLIAAISTVSAWAMGLIVASGSGLMRRLAKYALFSVYISMVWVAVDKIMDYLPRNALGLPPCAAHVWEMLQLSQAISASIAVLVVGFVTKQALAYWRDM